MTLQNEPQSFLEIARVCLKTDKLPKRIHDVLNTFFTKSDNSNHYRPKIINEKAVGQTQNKHPVLKGKKNAIHNILCIWYLLGDTKTTKQLMQEYAQKNVSEKTLNNLIRLTQKQYLEFFCLGVVRENVQKIIACLKSTDFDIFTQKLPSPFSTNKTDQFDISPLLTIYSKDIPWQFYMEQYQQAEEHFNKKRYNEARMILRKLESEAMIRLPIIEALNKNIDAIENEAEEAWNYFQKVLD